MKRIKLVNLVITTLVVFLTIADIAVAAVSGPPIQDTYTNINDPDTSYGTETLLWTTLSGDPGGNCTVSRITYLKWNLADASGRTIASAALTLTRVGATSNPNNYTIGLYRVGDGWDETSTWNTAPMPGTLIETKPFPANNGDTVVFNSSALASYLQSENTGDGVASLAIRLVSPGSCSGAVTIIFGSRTATPEANRPNLQVYGPNSVALSTYTSDTPAPTWPLYAGLAALVAIAAAGVVWSRRRAA